MYAIGQPMEETYGTTRPAYADDLYCPECGYSLRGLTSNRCPECGLILDFIESATTLIPWERRREIGRLRAYWQTVFQVMFRNKVFCRAAYRSVSHRDAQRFRWVTILHVFVPLLLSLLGWLVFSAATLANTADEMGGGWFIVVCGLGVLLALIAVTGLPSYFFHPRFLTIDRQNRAVALSYYGCAALACTPAALLLMWVTIAIGETQHDLDLVLYLLTEFAFIAVCLLSWVDLVEIAQRTLRRPSAVAKVALLVPVSWVIAAGLTVVGLPFAVYFVGLVVYSLE